MEFQKSDSTGNSVILYISDGSKISLEEGGNKICNTVYLTFWKLNLKYNCYFVYSLIK